MNRIILIGNGFDLAHGMKTSYNNFLDDYWEKTIAEIKTSNTNQRFENNEFSIGKSPSGFVSGNTFKDLNNAVTTIKSKIDFKNTFFKTITERSNIDKWVDVENEYYLFLKKTYDTNYKRQNSYSIKELNSDFKKVKELLRDYLVRVDEEFSKNIDTTFFRTKNTIGHKIYSPFKLQDFSEQSLNQKAEQEYSYLKTDIDALRKEEITMEDVKEEKRKLISKIGLDEPLKNIKQLLQSEGAINYFDLIPNQTLFLNFNYTFTDELYSDPNSFGRYNKDKFTETSFNHIHGTIDKAEKNPIIFGFGDELDEEYKSIERLNDNKYLENIKSINYLETDNYKRLLEFVNIENFQVFLFGHSCGISDRTLLNTVFEHENCASIKPFFHLRSENNDNYSDIVRSVSRNFNDKAMMRDRVVNKKYCEPLC